MATKKSTFTSAATLSDRDKLIIVSLRRQDVPAAALSKTFGMSTRSIAAILANATRGAGIYVRPLTV